MKGPMLLLFIAVLGVNIEGSPILKQPKAGCNEFCPNILSPVCGSDGNEYRMFVNDCQMMSYNCFEHKEFYAVKSELCNDEDIGRHLDCPTCPEIWAPVCGSDGFEIRTFANGCFLEAVNCMENRSFTTIKAGKCDGEDIWETAERLCGVCTRNFEPVCGFDGVETRSFANQCELESINCRESRNFRMKKEGTC